MVDIKKIALFAAGTLFGSAGFKLLSSSDAKKFYTQTTAAVQQGCQEGLHPDHCCRAAHEGLHHGDRQQGPGAGR